MTDKEFKELRDQVKSVLDYSQTIDCNDEIIDEIMEEWRRNKSWFIERLNGQLLYKLPKKVSFTLSPIGKEKNFNDFIDKISYYGLTNTELVRFLLKQGQEALFKNTVVSDYETFSGQKINKGMKLVKAFKYFVSNKDDLTDIQNHASRVIQEDRMEGYLCISAHPLDYLSMSENTYNWRSCHALDGEYCAGDLSYMCDSASLVCYICGEDEVNLPLFPPEIQWNSKKWRMMLYVEDKERGLMAGRQYPFELDNILPYLRDRILNPVLFNNCVQYWHQNMIKTWNDEATENLGRYDLNEPYVYNAGGLFPLSDIVEDAPESCHYNDLLKSSVYTPKSAIIDKSHSFIYETRYWKKVHFTIGSTSKCLKCGNPINQGESTMLCSYCYLLYGADNENVGYCEVCGSRHYIEDLTEVGDDGALLCEDCLSSSVARQCDVCGNWYFTNEIHEVDREGYTEYLCEWCHRDYLEEQKEKKSSKTVNFFENGVMVMSSDDSIVNLATFNEEIDFN